MPRSKWLPAVCLVALLASLAVVRLREWRPGLFSIGDSEIGNVATGALAADAEQLVRGLLSALFVLGLLLGALALFFLPAFVAGTRKHHNTNAIFALNLLLGWTVLGWVAALIWALTQVNPQIPPPASTGSRDEPVG